MILLCLCQFILIAPVQICLVLVRPDYNSQVACSCLGSISWVVKLLTCFIWILAGQIGWVVQDLRPIVLMGFDFLEGSCNNY